MSTGNGYIDVNERLVWSPKKLHRKRLVVFATGTLAAGVIVLLTNSPLERWGFGIAGIVFLGFAFYDIYRMLDSNAALIELLPQGIIYRVTSEDFIVPWGEIKGIDTINIDTNFGRRREYYPGVTVILVSKFFYDRVVHVSNIIMRGPGWGAWFVPRDDNTMMLALHHDVLPAGADEIRRQVEERWKAFGKTNAKTA